MFFFKGTGEIALALLVTNCWRRRRVKLILMMYEIVNVMRNRLCPKIWKAENNTAEH